MILEELISHISQSAIVTSQGDTVILLNGQCSITTAAEVRGTTSDFKRHISTLWLIKPAGMDPAQAGAKAPEAG